jgi:hypothetical protein
MNFLLNIKRFLRIVLTLTNCSVNDLFALKNYQRLIPIYNIYLIEKDFTIKLYFVTFVALLF